MLSRHFVISLLVILCGVLSACSKPDYETLSGRQGQFADLRGQWLVINYWAAWCKPCREEIPELNRLSQQFQGQLTVMAVNFDQPAVDILAQEVKEFAIDFTVLLSDPAPQLGFTRPTVLPSTVLINPQGQVQQTLVGPQTVATLSSAMALE